MEEIKKKSTDTTIKISRATKEKWDEIYNDSGFANQSMFMDELLERYYYPIKENKDLAEKINDLKDKDQQISELKQKYQQLQKELEDAKNANAEKQLEIESLNGKFSKLETDSAQAIEDLNSGFASKNASMMKDHILVPISPLERKCLEYLTEREKKERKRNDITPEVFFMYCLSEMLIKGNKFSIKCVPDSVIAKLQKEVDNGNE